MELPWVNNYFPKNSILAARQGPKYASHGLYSPVPETYINGEIDIFVLFF